MLLGEIFKNINKKYKKIKFKDIKFNSKDCKSNDIFLPLKAVMKMVKNILMMRSRMELK